MPVTVPAHRETDKEGNEVDVPETVVSRDDGPRAGTTLEKLAELKPVFKPDGSVTAGNACPLNDGAAALLIMSEEKAQKGTASNPAPASSAPLGGRDPPGDHGPRADPGDPEAARRHGARRSIDIDIVEINEAFAAQIVPCKEELGISDEQLILFGGAIALGHPFGMTGARIMTTLLNDLETTGGTFGIESMCVAGGMGMAMLVERLGRRAVRHGQPAGYGSRRWACARPSKN